MPSGRLSKDEITRQVWQIMREAGLYGSRVLRDYVRGFAKDDFGNPVSPSKKQVKVTGVKLKACLEAIAYTIGRPKESLELNDITQMSLKDLANLAEKADRKLDKNLDDTVTVVKAQEMVGVKDNSDN